MVPAEHRVSERPRLRTSMQMQHLSKKARSCLAAVQQPIFDLGRRRFDFSAAPVDCCQPHSDRCEARLALVAAHAQIAPRIPGSGHSSCQMRIFALNVRNEPTLTDAAIRSNGRYSSDSNDLFEYSHPSLRWLCCLAMLTQLVTLYLYVLVLNGG